MVLLFHPVHAPADVWIAQPVRLRDRVAVRLRARRLDAALARGVDPETGPALALRARTLTGVRRRRLLARGLLRRADAAIDPRTRWMSPRDRDARHEMIALAVELLRPGPLAVRGVAEAGLLLTDGRARGGDLAGAFATARRHLAL